MIEVKEQCKGCFHFQVCANVLKQQLFIREKMLKEENPKCEQYIPTADVVEVVRCKGCKYHRWEHEPEHGKTTHFCSVLNAEVFKDFYCSHGTPREEK